MISEDGERFSFGENAPIREEFILFCDSGEEL
jgi:hypothetical protein